MDDAGHLARIASGQKMMVWSVLVSFFASAFWRSAETPSTALLALLVALATVVLAIVGVVKLANALWDNTGVTVLCGLLMVVPLASLVAMLVLSNRATKRLRAGGYSVGLMGARSP